MEFIRKQQRLIKPVILKEVTVFELGILVPFLIFLMETRNSHHLLFHTAAEFFTCIAAFGLLFISINTTNISENSFIFFLGIGYLFAGILDMFHIFTYPGVSIIFKNGSQSIVVQFWISARYMTAITLLGSTFLLIKGVNKLKKYLVFYIYFISYETELL